MDSPIRIGIVGCGQIAQQHLRIYKDLPGAQIVSYCDANRLAAEETAAIFGACDLYEDYRELLARDDIDSVDVCLHNNLHMPVTVAALRAGKHVYCEKPMAGSYRDAEAMLSAAKETGKKLHIQLGTLFTNEARAAKELIDGGEIGEPYFARSSGFRRRNRPYVDGYGTANFVQKRHASGGALYDMGVYHIAQILYLIGNPPVERVSGRTYQKVAMDDARRRESGYDVEEFAVGLVRLEGDKTMELIECWAVNLDDLEGSFVLGDRGGIRLRPFGFFKSVGNLEMNSTVNLQSAKTRWATVVGQGPEFGESQAHWIAALQGKVELLPTAEIALNTMLISEAVYLSHELRREVSADEVREASVSNAISPRDAEHHNGAGPD